MKTRHDSNTFVRIVIGGIVLALWSQIGLAQEKKKVQEKKKPVPVTFEDDVLPIFRAKCLSCHNADKKKGDLDLSNYGVAMLGGGSGEVVEAGESDASYLYSLITHESEPFMPPEQPKLPDKMIETIRKWIDGGILESKSSKAKLKKKKTFDLALQSAPTERPKVAPMPPRLSLEPVTRTNATSAVSAIATSPWSPLAAVGSQKQVLLYNTKTLELVGALPFPEGVPQVLKFSRNGSLLLAGGGRSGANGKAIVWNVQTGERVFEVGDELDTVLAADISSDQTLIALGGPQRVVRIYSTETGRLLHELRKHTDWVCSLEFSPDSVLLATGDRSGGLYVWEGWTGREYLTLKAHSACVTGVSWRSDSNVVASCSEDGSIRLWEMNNGGQIKNWGAHGGGAASIEFARDGKILSCGRDRVAKLWDQNGKAIRSFEAFGDLALRVTYCNETNRAIAGDWTGAIRVWNAADGARVGELSPNPPKLAERLDGANKLLAAKTAEHQPLAQAYQVAQAAFDKANGELTAAQKAAAEAKKRLDGANGKLEAAKQTLTKATAANEVATKAVNALAPGVPALNDASAKAQDAVSKLPGDKEIAELAAKLKAAATKRQADLDARKKTAQTNTAALKAAGLALPVATKEATDSDAAHKAAQAILAKRTPLVKPAQDAATAAKQKADQAAAALAAAQNNVKRWTGEIAFANQLRDLTLKRDEALKALEQREVARAELDGAAATALTVLNKAKGELTAAQNNVVAAQKQTEVATAELNSAKQNAAKAEAARVGAAKTGSALETVFAPLAEAALKAKEAVAKLSGDKELAVAAAMIQKRADAKKVEFEAAKKDLDAKTKAVAATKKLVVSGEAKLVASKAALAAVQKQATDLAAAMQPIEKKAADTKNAADAGAKSVAEAQQAVDESTARIAVAKGIESA